MTPTGRLRGVGPTTARMLREVEIESVEALREIGAVQAYLRLRFRFERLSLNALYALHAGLLDRDWRRLTDAERAALRRAIDDAST